MLQREWRSGARLGDVGAEPPTWSVLRNFCASWDFNECSYNACQFAPHKQYQSQYSARRLYTMGWFSTPSPSSSSEKPATIDAPKPSNDGGFIAPDRTQRQLCWEGRDGFFACLDKNNIIDSVKEGDKAASLCGQENTAFEKNCASSWVSAFKQGTIDMVYGGRWR